MHFRLPKYVVIVVLENMLQKWMSDLSDIKQAPAWISLIQIPPKSLLS